MNKSLAISLSIMLLLSGTLVVSNAQPLPLTTLSLNPLSSNIVAVGDHITFTGTLATLNGKVLANMTINIMAQTAGTSGPVLLVSAKTDNQGNYNATWTADLADPNNSRRMTVYTAFSGTSGYSGSKSTTVPLVVGLQDMKVSISYDKQTYFTGQVAVFTVTFAGPAGNPVDPDTLTTIYDAKNVSLEKQSQGTYVYRTPPLTPPTHTLQVVASKYGYAHCVQISEGMGNCTPVYNGANTITVFSPQTLPGVLVNLNWTPKEIMPGTPVSFTLKFTDLNNVVTPYVNYNITITKDSQVVANMLNQQTNNGTAAFTQKFDAGGNYKVTVNVNGIGPADSFITIRQSSDFSITVLNPALTAVKVKAIEKNNLMRISFLNPSLGTSVYGLQLTFSDASGLKINPPSGWSVNATGNTVMVNTGDTPMDPGKVLRLQVTTKSAVDSFSWSAMDKDGKELNGGTAKVFQLRIM